MRLRADQRSGERSHVSGCRQFVGLLNSFPNGDTLAAFVEPWQDFQLRIQIIFLLEQFGLRADAIVEFFVLRWIWTVRNSFPAISVRPNRNHKIFRQGPDFADRFLDHHLKLLRCFLSDVCQEFCRSGSLAGVRAVIRPANLPKANFKAVAVDRTRRRV
jgi:hypothetical protein